MRRQMLALAVAVLLVPVLASAHVTVRPRESKSGAEERYTIRVPTEGVVSTTKVEPEGATHELKRANGRVVAIVWTKEIKAKEAAEFLFVARNPSGASEIAWKAHQHFADGTVSDWTGPPSKRPASITQLAAK